MKRNHLTAIASFDVILFEMKIYLSLFLIHSANPQSRPVGIIVFAHVVRPYPLFKSSKTKQKNNVRHCRESVGRAEWIIDDTCLVYLYFFNFFLGDELILSARNLTHIEHVVEINQKPATPPPLPTVTEALKQHYMEYFADWFEPGNTTLSRILDNDNNAIRRRSSRKKNLHQKLVLSTMNTKRATKLDMDDRAKMMQYFSKPGDVKSVESVKIEDMFGTCWSVPHACPPLPTVITVQAPAGIGKSSMLKYMCMKWGCNELWTSNFDVLIFVECRTLNRLGSLTGRQFMSKILEPVENKVRLECCLSDDSLTSQHGLLDELTVKAGAGRVLLLLDGLDEVHDVGNLATIRQPAGNPDRLGQPGKGAADSLLSPLEFAQCLLTGALLPGCHVIVTSRPHTLSHLQSSRWFLSLPKRMVSLDIQGLSEEGVQSFIHR